MKTEAFWENVKQMIEMTCSTCKVMESQEQDCEAYEKEMIALVAKKCESQLALLKLEK